MSTIPATNTGVSPVHSHTMGSVGESSSSMHSAPSTKNSQNGKRSAPQNLEPSSPPKRHKSIASAEGTTLALKLTSSIGASIPAPSKGGKVSHRQATPNRKSRDTPETVRRRVQPRRHTSLARSFKGIYGVHQFWKESGDKPGEISFQTDKIELPPVREVPGHAHQEAILDRLREAWQERHPSLRLIPKLVPDWTRISKTSVNLNSTLAPIQVLSPSSPLSPIDVGGTSPPSLSKAQTILRTMPSSSAPHERAESSKAEPTVSQRSPASEPPISVSIPVKSVSGARLASSEKPAPRLPNGEFPPSGLAADYPHPSDTWDDPDRLSLEELMTKEELGSLKEVLDEARTEWLQTVAKADVEDSSEEEDITDDRFMCLHWRLEVKERWRNTLKSVFGKDKDNKMILPTHEEYLKTVHRRSYYRRLFPGRLPIGEWPEAIPPPEVIPTGLLNGPEVFTTTNGTTFGTPSQVPIKKKKRKSTPSSSRRPRRSHKKAKKPPFFLRFMWTSEPVSHSPTAFRLRRHVLPKPDHSTQPTPQTPNATKNFSESLVHHLTPTTTTTLSVPTSKEHPVEVLSPFHSPASSPEHEQPIPFPISLIHAAANEEHPDMMDVDPPVHVSSPLPNTPVSQSTVAMTK